MDPSESSAKPASPKRLAVFVDGTWNWSSRLGATTVLNDHSQTDTNVSRLFYSLAEVSGQSAFYSYGLGGSRGGRFHLTHKFLGGATGFGISTHIQPAYEYLVSKYEPGDLIYLFGFSRGAFAVRSLSGMINACGIVRRDCAKNDFELAHLCRTAFLTYQSERPIAQCAFKEKHSYDSCRIEMMGVWDTVAAVGLPLNWLELVNPWPATYHRVELNPLVRAAYHALAIDETRKAFVPTLFDERSSSADQIVEQVWFAGSHSDIGGGYRERELADITLGWMTRKATAHGLRFREKPQLSCAKSYAGQLHDPRAKWGCLFLKATRAIPVLRTTKISRTVEQRALDPDVNPRYAPENIVDVSSLASNYSVVDPLN